MSLASVAPLIPTVLSASSNVRIDGFHRKKHQLTHFRNHYSTELYDLYISACAESVSPMKWFNSHRLLLVYKDDLVLQKGLVASARIAESLTILEHRKLAGARAEDNQQALPFGMEPGYNNRYSENVPPHCCVWGWWRKPWESHNELFAALREGTRSATKPVAFLYNQYLRRLYHSTVHDVYFESGLSSVVVPGTWRARCPEYYRDTPHLCGAFLVLDINPVELDAKNLGKLFVDAQSFEFESRDWSTIVPPPEDAFGACSSMIDSTPRRASLRVSEATMLVLRPVKQKENTARLLKLADFSDADLAVMLRDTAWDDTLEVLSHASLATWARLSVCPTAIQELGRKARESVSRLTRLDFELVAQACASPELQELLATQNGDGVARLAPLGEALRLWVTTSGEKEARRAAATVFKHAWSAAAARYHVAPLSEKYLDHLPAMEAIASAVRHELGKKFYRDHLSHNVRAALLSARLAEKTGEILGDGLNDCAVAFFSGLFHDIALPVTAFPDTVGSLAQALATVQLTDGVMPTFPGVLDRRHLRRSLAYVALIAATPNVSSTLLDDLLAPWLDPDRALKNVDLNLLFEELLCAGSDEHALTSAAFLFDAAVRGLKGKVDFDTGVRSLLSRMSGAGATRDGRELASILQSMALHDRKAATVYLGVNEPSLKTPKALYWSGFQMPMVVTIADEFQEWGRTVGAIEGLGAVDASINVEAGKVIATIALSERAATFASVPYSLFESMLGKVRNIGKLVYDHGGIKRSFEVSIETGNLGAFCLSYASQGGLTIIHFKDGHEFMSLSEVDSQRSNEVHSDTGSELLRVVVDAPGYPGRDYLLLHGNRQLLTKCVALGKERTKLAKITFDGMRLRLVFGNGLVIEGTIESYRFGDVGSDSAPSSQFPDNGAIAVLRVGVTKIDTSATDAIVQRPQMAPAPHFLDKDWRFTERTASLISNYCKAQAQIIGSDICYLGCPTVALWHSKHNSVGPEWLLLDKGHFALTQWLETQIPSDKFLQFDVFTPLNAALRNKFAIVIADPPWYENEYEAFWRQAQALVKPSGIIGITYYPQTLDPVKYRQLQTLMRSEYAHFGATEIDYEVPDFESISGLQSKFEHSESGIYRPGYMDFYQAPPTKKEIIEDYVMARATADRLDDLPFVKMIDDVHFMRCREWVKDPSKYPFRVTAVRRGVDHLKAIHHSCAAWTTRNLEVNISPDDQGEEVSNLDELLRFVAKRDSDHKLKAT